MAKNKVPLVSLDTNVYLSSALLPGSCPGKIFKAWQTRSIQIAISKPIIDEITAVLRRPYFQNHLKWNEKLMEKYIGLLTKNALIAPGTTKVDICRDPKDNMVFSCAAETRADYIVSGDKDILEIKNFQGIPVKSPREFVDEVLKLANPQS